MIREQRSSRGRIIWAQGIRTSITTLDRGTRFFSSQKRPDQLRAHRASYWVGTGVISQQVTRSEDEVNHSSLPYAEVKHEGSYTFAPLIWLHDVHGDLHRPHEKTCSEKHKNTRNALRYRRGPVGSVGIATRYRLDSPEIECRWGPWFSAPVQTGPRAHPPSYTIGTGCISRGKSGRGVALNTTPSNKTRWDPVTGAV